MMDIDDILIIGAGVSGIGMACHLARSHPGLKVRVVERRAAMGGTWDLFRYPGVRSDSDMFTYGYQFRPWQELKVLSDGPSIKAYIEDTARDYRVHDKVSFGLKAEAARWSSREGLWDVEFLHEASGERRHLRCRFLINATGYYDFDRGHAPEFAGMDRYQGQLIHPQHWPEHFSCAGKRVVIIGSGATAVTLAPTLAQDAAHVTMLQRSPTYMMSLLGHDKLSEWLLRVLPKSWVYGMARRRNLALGRFIYRFARRHPQRMRRFLLGHVMRRLDGKVDQAHFTPRYQPWDERLCVVKDGDLFTSLREGRVEVLTDEIASFTRSGLRLKSGQELEADIVITATGLQLQTLGGMRLLVDGQEKKLADLLSYKATLLQDVPNFAWLFGYINASWTLKVDLSAAYLCRLISHMKAHGAEICTPRAPAGEALDASVMSALSSGYVKRSSDLLPRQGRHLPWRVTNDYLADQALLLRTPVADPALELTSTQTKEIPEHDRNPVLV